MMHHWKTYGEKHPDYIGSHSFQPGERKVVTITGVEERAVRDPNGKAHTELVVVLAEDQPLIVNRTNGKMITKVLGTPYVEDWAGKRIVLAVERVNAFGELMDAVRVQSEKVPSVIKCADCGQTITAVGRMSDIQIASGTRKTYGKELCWNCAEKRKGGQE